MESIKGVNKRVVESMKEVNQSVIEMASIRSVNKTVTESIPWVNQTVVEWIKVATQKSGSQSCESTKQPWESIDRDPCRSVPCHRW
jgi:hypothetical protein